VLAPFVPEGTSHDRTVCPTHDAFLRRIEHKLSNVLPSFAQFLKLPGLDKRLQRVPRLYSRVGFVHGMELSSQQGTRFFLAQRWSHPVSADSEDSTD
jgi:hypothetical protein